MFKNIPGKMSVLEAPGAIRKAATMGRVGPLNILLSANGMIIRSRMSQYVGCVLVVLVLFCFAGKVSGLFDLFTCILLLFFFVGLFFLFDVCMNCTMVN